MATKLRAGITTAALALSLMAPHGNGQQQAILRVGSEPTATMSGICSVIEAHGKTSVVYNTYVSSNSLPLNGYYVLHASTEDGRCYAAGVNFNEGGKIKLFMRTEDQNAKSEPKREDCGYNLVANSQAQKDLPNQKSIGTKIMPGDVITAQLSVNGNGTVSMSILNDRAKDAIALTLKDSANTFYRPPFHIPPGMPVKINGQIIIPRRYPPIKQIVTSEKENWIFK